MAAIAKFIKDLFYVFMFGIIGGAVGSLALLFSITSLYQSPLITLLITALFIPFHFNDLRQFYAERGWISLMVRLGFLSAIMSFIVGFFRFSTGYGTVDWYFPLFLMIAVPVLFVLITIYMFFLFFLPENRLFVSLRQKWKDFERGGRIYGFWWNS